MPLMEGRHAWRIYSTPSGMPGNVLLRVLAARIREIGVLSALAHVLPDRCVQAISHEV